ncbi:MAG: hypothetical protein SVR94_13600, partial [Pseudomonadota bacterium]|nr:hypothetical protein [Pseudomonadota bacterium]
TRKEIIALKILVIPHLSGEHQKAVLIPRSTSFRTQKQQIKSHNLKEPKYCYIARSKDNIYQETFYIPTIETKGQVVLYKGPLVAQTKNSIPWAKAQEHKPYEAKNSYLENIFKIVQQPPFSNWLTIEYQALTKKIVGKKQQISKKQRRKEISQWLKSTSTEKYSIVFANARHQSLEVNVIEAIRSFCLKYSYELSVCSEIALIDITDESTLTETVNAFINKISSENCFPIFFVDEIASIEEEQWDPKPAIDKLLHAIPHHAIANPKILYNANQNTETEIDVIIANLIIKKEVVEGQLWLNRTGTLKNQLLSNNIDNYLFCTETLINNDFFQYFAVHISNTGQLKFFIENSDCELAEIADEKQWQQVWLDQAPNDTAQETLLIHDQGIRVVPPISPTKKGWSETAGIYSISEVSGYYASYYERPKDKIEKGIIVREIKRKKNDKGKFELATQQDMENLSQLCIDPYVRVNSATVIPFPYKHLREWIFLKKRNLANHE